MHHQYPIEWTLGYNDRGMLYPVPILETIKNKIGFHGSCSKYTESLSETAIRENHPIYLADREAFPEMSELGELQISPTIYIKNFLVKAKDLVALRSAMDIVNSKRK